MTNTELLATKVMGWHKIADGYMEWMLEKWNPYESIADAWMIVEKIRKAPIKVRNIFDSNINSATLGMPSRITPEIVCNAALKTLEV